MRTENSALPVQHLALLLGALVLAAGGHAWRLSWWVGVGAGAVFLWRMYIAWKDRPLPSKWLLMGTALLALVGVFLTFRSLVGRDAGVTLLVLLLALKLMEMRAARDVFVLIFVGYFLALTNFFYSQTIATGGLMVLTVLALTAALVSVQAPNRAIRANMRTAGALMAQGAPVMLLLFVLFPRVQGPLWGVPQDVYGGITGLSDSMSPGTLSRLGQSDAIAFRVRFEGRVPPPGQLYWRGPVFWSFDGLTWRPGSQSLRNSSYEFQGTGEPVEYEITLEPHNRFWMFGLELPFRLPPNARLSGDFQVLSRTPLRTRTRYTMRSYPAYRMEGGSDEEIRAALALPKLGNTRSRALGEGWRTQYKTDEAIVSQGIAFFRSGGFAYTLQPPLLEKDMVDEFLFDTKQGFCEHFASSFTYLMRAAGVPARVVTGYQGGEINPVDGYVEVHQADAHAWSEVFLKGRGWVRVDPTAAAAPIRVDGGFEAAIPASALPLFMRQDWSWLRSARFNWSALTNQWNQWVLGYTTDRQRDLLSRLGVSQPDWGTLAHLLFWSVTGVMGITALYLLWRVKRRDAVQALWLRFCTRLARRGFVRRDDEGPLAYGERVAGSLPQQASGVRDIASLYIELRYGRDHSTASIARLRRLVAAFHP